MIGLHFSYKPTEKEWYFSRMLTHWNLTYNLPIPLAEPIAGYNRWTKLIFLTSGIGVWNGTSSIQQRLWNIQDPSSDDFVQRAYRETRGYKVESYTNVDSYVFFTDNHTLYEFAMTSNPGIHAEIYLSTSHYADRPCITTDQRYLFLTGGFVNDEVVGTVSMYDYMNNQWLSYSIPNMLTPRIGHNCISSNGWLYVFGGFVDKDLNITTDTVEKLYIPEITDGGLPHWRYVQNRLSEAIAYMRVAEVNQNIYVIGGYSPQNDSSVSTVNILDIETDEITEGEDLPIPTNRRCQF